LLRCFSWMLRRSVHHQNAFGPSPWAVACFRHSIQWCYMQPISVVPLFRYVSSSFHSYVHTRQPDIPLVQHIYTPDLFLVFPLSLIINYVFSPNNYVQLHPLCLISCPLSVRSFCPLCLKPPPTFPPPEIRHRITTRVQHISWSRILLPDPSLCVRFRLLLYSHALPHSSPL
jgi:hypothetical protein